MIPFTPLGTARQRFVGGDGPGPFGDAAALEVAEGDDFEAAYLGWEIARSLPGVTGDDRRALALLAAMCVSAMHAGSTRVSLEDARLARALQAFGAVDMTSAVKSIVARGRAALPNDPVTQVLGQAKERKPLVVEGAWVYTERMRALEERFCAGVRDRLGRPAGARDARSLGRAVAAVEAGPPPLTDEQKRAVGAALGGPLAVITGGPGTGKTTIVVAMLRALAWLGVPMESVALAAPTGKAAQRLQEAISTGLGSVPRDIAEAGLRSIAPSPQTLHRLLGWSPSSRRFARHENDPLPHRVVVVDEASMVDLAMMDRLLRALRDDARLVLLGDADQLPSVEAGAVFRDLCAGTAAVRLSVNLRVVREPSALRIVAAARAVNAGTLDASFSEAVTVRRSVDDVAFQGVEHLSARWADVGEALLDRWRERLASPDGFAERVARTYRAVAGVFDEESVAELRKLFDHHARMRLLCATRVRGFATSAETLNDRLLARLSGRAGPERWRRPSELAAGTPVLFERNDYERQLFNGDQGIVVLVDAPGAGSPARMAVFPRGEGYGAIPIDAFADFDAVLRDDRPQGARVGIR